jgi:hypothetical protein
MDAQSRFVVSLVTDRRTPQTLRAVVKDFADRTGQRPPRLVTTDDCAAYEPVLLECYGKPVEVRRRKDGEIDRRFRPVKAWPQGSVYGTVKKTFQCGQVATLHQKLTLGTPEDLCSALSASSVSSTINTSFIERQNGTDRAHNSRKARKALTYSKDLLVHLAVSWWVMFCYNFHFFNAGLDEVRGIDQQRRRPRRILHHRTPAMAKGLTHHAWTIAEILLTPLFHKPSISALTLGYFRPWPKDTNALL